MLPILLACTAPRPTALIVVDTLRRDLAGHEAPWQDEARTYTQARSVAGYTTTSTATLLTGLWPDEHGVTHAPRQDVQQIHGSTVLGEVQSLAVSDHWILSHWGMLETATESRIGARLTGPCDGSPWAVDVAAGWDGDGMLYLHLVGPHGPWGLSGADDLLTTSMREPWPETADWHEAVYSDCAARSLETVAGVLDALPEGTTTIITSDHGELLGEHGWHGHGKGWPVEVTRVPLWVLGPDIEPGTVTEPVQPVAVAGMVRSALAGVEF